MSGVEGIPSVMNLYANKDRAFSDVFGKNFTRPTIAKKFANTCNFCGNADGTCKHAGKLITSTELYDAFVAHGGKFGKESQGKGKKRKTK